MYEGIEDTPITSCPHCGSTKIRKAGHLPTGYQRYHCRNCNKKISVLTTAIYYRKTDVECPYCHSFHTRLAGTLKDGTRRHVCCDCNKGFSAKTIIREEIKETCPFCKGNNLRRDGVRNGVQRYYCKDCKIVFTPGSQKFDVTKKKIQKAYREGAQIWKLSQTFNLTERTVRSHVKRCNHKKHREKVLNALPNGTKRDVIYFRLGAGVSFSDITQYLKVDKEIAKIIIEKYKKQVGAI